MAIGKNNVARSNLKMFTNNTYIDAFIDFVQNDIQESNNVWENLWVSITYFLLYLVFCFSLLYYSFDISHCI